MRKRYGPDYDPNVFKRWENDGLIEKLRNGLYRNRSVPLKGDLDRFIVAGMMYSPSYISLHSAFRYYNFIPENVIETTSVTTRKTKAFRNHRGRFSFRKIDARLYWGADMIEWNGGLFSMARPEKCLLDMAYLEPQFSDPDWIEGMRFDGEEIVHHIDIDRMMFYSRVINSKVVQERIGLLLEVLEL